MKKIAAFTIGIFLTSQLALSVALAAPITLSDIAGHKYQTAIEYLKNRSVIGGYSDGTFKPNNTINRAELLKILVGGAGYAKPDENMHKNCFPDVKTEWYAAYVCFAKQKGWIGGYSDGTFRPEQMINKVEAMKMLVNSQSIATSDTSSKSSAFTDVNLADWYGPYLFAVESKKIIEKTENMYYPDVYITRGEISNNIYRSILTVENNVASFDLVPGIQFEDVKKDEVKKENETKPEILSAPGIEVSSMNPSSILVKLTPPTQTGGSPVKMYVVEYKTGNEFEYAATEYSIEFYSAKEKSDGGIIFASKPSTMYHFRVKAINETNHQSSYSSVKSITTAAPLEPAAPTIQVVSQTYSDITLTVKFPTYTGDSPLESVFESFTNPSSGYSESGSLNIAGNNFVGSWTKKYNLEPKATDIVPPTYTFTFWVDNKNGKISEKGILKVPGLSANPGTPIVTSKALTSNSASFEIKAPAYIGSGPIAQYFYKIESTSDPQGNSGSGNYSKDFFEKELNGILTIADNLPANTTYTVSFWVSNIHGKASEKVTKNFTTSSK